MATGNPDASYLGLPGAASGLSWLPEILMHHICMGLYLRLYRWGALARGSHSQGLAQGTAGSFLQPLGLSLGGTGRLQEVFWSPWVVSYCSAYICNSAKGNMQGELGDCRRACESKVS